MENRKNEILKVIERVNLDIELVNLEIKSHKLMKRSTISTMLIGILTLIVIGFSIYTSENSFNFIHSICISFVTSTIVLQINEIFNYKTNIRKSLFSLQLKNDYLEELKEELKRL